MQPDKQTATGVAAVGPGRLLLAWLVVVGLIAVVYWPALFGGLVWDDAGLVQSHGMLSLDNWFGKSFGSPFLQNYYRPLPILSLMLGSLWGEQYFVLLAHAGNIVLFCLNTLLVMALVYIAAARVLWVPVLAGLLYALHPAFLEPVAWMSCRSDLLLAFFCLLGLWLDTLLAHRPTVRILAVCGCLWGAALSKETAVVFPVLWLGWRLYGANTAFGVRPVWAWLQQGHHRRDLLLLLCTGVLYLVLRQVMLGHFLHAIDNHAAPAMLARVLLAAHTFLWFVLLQVFPHYDLSVVYLSPAVPGWTDTGVLAGGALLLLTVSLLFMPAVSARVKYLLAVWLCLFLPVSNLVDMRLTEGFIHLRFVLLPVTVLIVFGLPLVGARLQQATAGARALLALVAGLWLVASFLNLRATVPLWGNDNILWRWVTATKPASSVGWSNYAMTLSRQGQWQACTEAYTQAGQQAVVSPYLTLHAARCHYALKQWPATRRLLAGLFETPQATVNLEPDAYSSALGLYGRATVDSLLAATGAAAIPHARFEEIQALFQAALQRYPANREAMYALVAWQWRNGEQAAAMATLRQSLRDPSLRQGQPSAPQTMQQPEAVQQQEALLRAMTALGWLDADQLADLARQLPAVPQ